MDKGTDYCVKCTEERKEELLHIFKNRRDGNKYHPFHKIFYHPFFSRESIRSHSFTSFSLLPLSGHA